MKFSLVALSLALGTTPSSAFSVSITSSYLSSLSSPTSYASRLQSTLAPEAPALTADDDGNEDDSGNDRKQNQKPVQVFRHHSTHKITTHKGPLLVEEHIMEQQSNSDTNSDQGSNSNNNNHNNHRGAISMSLDELALVLGGKGRAQIVWDCYKLGIDPSNMFGSVIRLGYDDYESIVNQLPSQRRSQRLGPDTLQKLKQLYRKSSGSEKVSKVEGGVATLSYISRASDDTTKLLLKLSDGLEVETVIIPWKGKRSTLCISSQVGCKQGKSR
jgi:hypothetical protein